MNFIRRLFLPYPRLKQFIKFCFVGGTAAAINFIIYYSATEFYGWWYIFSAMAAFLISAIFNFSFNKLWTFRNKEVGKDIIVQVAKFVIVMVMGLLINITIIYFCTDWLGFDYKISWIFATGAVTFWSFSFNKLWTFRVSNKNTGLSEGE